MNQAAVAQFIKSEELSTDKMAPMDTGMLDMIGLSKSNYFAVIFVLLLSSMETRQDTILGRSKRLVLNSQIQNQLNKQIASIKFIQPSATATANRRQAIQEEDQQYAALRDDIQNDLITARQSAEIQMTQATTDVNILEQDASENSGWLKTLSTIFQVIDGMTQNS